MGDLGARRRIAFAAIVQRTGGAIAQREDVVVQGRLQRLAHQQLVDAVAFQPVQAVEELRRLHPGGPYLEARRDHLAGGQGHAVGVGMLHRRAGQHGHAELFQGLVHRHADALRQRRQHAGTGLDQGDLHVLRLDALQPVGGQPQRGVVQLGGQLDPGGAGADDGHADLALVVAARVGAQVVAEQLAVEALGLGGGVEQDAVLGHARCAEIIGAAADGDDQGVVVQAARRYQLAAVLVEGRGQADALGGAVQALQAADLELEVVPLGLGDIVELVLGRVQRAGGHFVQQRFPQVGEIGVNQGDVGLATLAQGAAQTGGELQPAGAAADDNDAMSHGKRSGT